MQQTDDTRFDSLIQATDRLLWDRYRAAARGEHEPGKLTFPKTAKGHIRVSEQEAKQLLIENLRGSMFSYTVETPTKEIYGFTGVGQRNAMTDLTLYSKGLRYVNIEFKSGGFSPERLKHGMITKDIAKLAKENVNGYWFHTLTNVDRASLDCLWQTIRRELKNVVAATANIHSKQFTFHCCVLRQAFSVQTTFKLSELSREPGWLGKLVTPTYRISKGQVLDLAASTDWRLSCDGQTSVVAATEAP